MLLSFQNLNLKNLYNKLITLKDFIHFNTVKWCPILYIYIVYSGHIVNILCVKIDIALPRRNIKINFQFYNTTNYEVR